MISVAAESRLDPTGCMDLRRKLMTLHRIAVSRWRSDLHHLIVGEDVLGIGRNSLIPMEPSERVERFTAYARSSVARSFDLRVGVSRLMDKAYSRGFLKAYGEEKREIPATSHPRASSLYVTQFLNDVVAITEATLQQIVRSISVGVVSSQAPGKVYRAALVTLRKIPLQRLTISGQTLITQAFNHGRLDAYSELGVEKVGVRAEHMPGKPVLDARTDRLVALQTAGDDHVCSICEDLEGEEYTIEEARGVIPVHPNCRCIFVRVEE